MRTPFLSVLRETRLPELQLTNDKLTEQIAEICDRAELDEDQERKLKREFTREYHLITREDRLERVVRISWRILGAGVCLPTQWSFPLTRLHQRHLRGEVRYGLSALSETYWGGGEEGGYRANSSQ